VAKCSPFEVRRSPMITAAGPEEARRKYAETVVDPAVAAARTVTATEGLRGVGEQLDLPELIACLKAQASEVQKGDLSRVEGTLMNQATALQSLFTRLTERAMGATELPLFESYMRMALRSQAQCRATLETLAATKNPPLIYARQANIANGPQQVNNGPVTRTREIETPQTQLSGEAHELLPDARAPGFASRADSSMEAMAAINGTEISRG